MAGDPIQETQVSVFIGMVLGLISYGVSLCQFYYYLRTYPCDKSLQRYLVVTLWLLNTLQTYCLIALEWSFIVLLRNRNIVHYDTMLWETTINLSLEYIIPFVVQCFYAHRLWIMSGRNTILILVVVLLSCSLFVIGLAYVNSVLAVLNARTPTRATRRNHGIMASSIRLPTLSTIRMDPELQIASVPANPAS
ncbi:hypothetical protein HYDPIDRAFT_37267 [Hydnomerulius pinastri MD-312]|nr:hypothetical protein HYDPIDRAFT_37267 [Hydnomerulius pinastri MD-312]